MKSIYLITASHQPAGILDFECGEFKVRLAPEFLSSKDDLERLLRDAVQEGVFVRSTAKENGKILEIVTKINVDDIVFISAVRDLINTSKIGTPRLFAIIKPDASDAKGGAE